MVNEPIIELAEEICRAVPCAEQVRFTSTGSEATFFALRVARTASGRDKIMKFEGGYHGAHDYSMMSATPRSPKAFPAPVPDSSGIPHALEAEVLIAPYNDLATVEGIVATHADELAAVIIEPFQRLIPPQPGFLAGLREITRRYGVLLVFDEVVTGFRVGMGGAAGYFGVTPDLTVLGKAVSGGYPMAGGVGGREDVMAVFGSGLDGKSGAHVQVGGTLSANPLSCAAGYFAIEEMARTNAPVVAGRAGDRLAAGLQQLVTKHALPYVVYNQGSIVHLECSGVMLLDMHNPVKLFKENKPRKQLMEQMGAAYTANGIITLAGSRLYTSMADTDAVIDDALERFDRVFSMVEGV
jgi:glutamate-1-semialdehyde aminotransferase